MHKRATLLKLMIGFFVLSAISADAQDHRIKDFKLISHANEAFAMAQDLYGPAKPLFRIDGIRFIKDGPTHEFFKKTKAVIIELNNKTSNEQNAVYQLSHEVFHFLSLSKYGKSINFEEGLANHFAVQYLRKVGMPITRSYMGERYGDAYDDVFALSQIYPDMVEKIKTVRRRQPDVSRISYKDFKKIFPLASDDLARRLTTRFPKN